MLKRPFVWAKAGIITFIFIVSVVIWVSGSRAGSKFSKDFTGDVEGQVVSEFGPVENARVRIAGQLDHTLTDRQGRFILRSAHAEGLRLLITAGKEGWFNNGQVAVAGTAMDHITLYPVPRDDRSDYRFISPVVCARCHVKLTKIYDQSKMAHTTSNPKVLQLYYGTDTLKRTGQAPGYKLDNPGQDGDCIACHAPSIAASNPVSGDLLDALYSARSEWDGISCDYCHKVRRVLKDTTKPSGFKAIMTRQVSRSGNSILVFGPYDDVVAPPMSASYNPLYKEGQYCSQCHSHFKALPEDKSWDWKKVYTEAEWHGFGLKDGKSLPVQTTYQEWKEWQDQLGANDPNKGKKCQDCHMSWRKDMLPYDNYIIDGQAREMWGNYRDPKTIQPHQFDGGTAIQLATALSMEVEGSVDNKMLTVSVFITNTNGGHWVPTGETMRSVLLQLNATDENGKPLKMIEGQRLPQWVGPEHGKPGAAFARVLQNDKGDLNVPYWQATSVAMDSRIRPKTSVTLTFKYALANEDDEPTVKAELVYRPVHQPWAVAKKWDVKDIPITSAVW